MSKFFKRLYNGLKVAAEFGIITSIILIGQELGIKGLFIACFIGFLYGYNARELK